MKPIDGRTLSHETSEHIRLMALRRVRAGERPSEVMRSYGLCRTTIYKWLRAAQRGGESALKSRKAPGPTPKLTARQKQQVFRWINGRDPRQYGFDFGLWTRKIVQLRAFAQSEQPFRSIVNTRFAHCEQGQASLARSSLLLGFLLPSGRSL